MAENRAAPQFSMCGLNCGLCPRYHTDGSSRCPGCGGEGFAQTRPSCGVLSCGRRHGVQVCAECEEFPCAKLEKAVCMDSFITHQRMVEDMTRARDEGLAAYLTELDEKMAMLKTLLDGYNDGRRKGFFCLAVNLLPVEDVRTVMARLAAEAPADMPVKARAAQAVGLLEEMGQAQGIELKLRKK